MAITIRISLTLAIYQPSGCPKPHSARIVVGSARQVKVRKRKMARAKAQVPIHTKNGGPKWQSFFMYIHICIYICDISM